MRHRVIHVRYARQLPDAFSPENEPHAQGRPPPPRSERLCSPCGDFLPDIFQGNHAFLPQRTQPRINRSQHLRRFLLGAIKPIPKHFTILRRQVEDGVLDFFDGAHGPDFYFDPLRRQACFGPCTEKSAASNAQSRHEAAGRSLLAAKERKEKAEWIAVAGGVAASGPGGGENKNDYENEYWRRRAERRGGGIRRLSGLPRLRSGLGA